ncbi:MAG TPA: DUF3761 domain-containing protein [Xanthobacteraceae bacterium]|nr:DUF3761 domain-containing protein [Xanthobacteraceae bacterium]
MSGEHKAYLLMTLLILAILVAARYPTILFAFAGKATARCRDGSLSNSMRRRGTCSHHGGVAEFLAI